MYVAQGLCEMLRNSIHSVSDLALKNGDPWVLLLNSDRAGPQDSLVSM